jgi:hypothetical protein
MTDCICGSGYVDGRPPWLDVKVAAHVHDPDCPRHHADVHTADDVVKYRQYLMDCSAEGTFAEGTSDVDVPALARGVTARAVELGLERP